jgi:hypothetical protein
VSRSIADCQLPIADFAEQNSVPGYQLIGNRQLAIGNDFP